MISDEMRELLSTYVDGELRDSDAVRVEEMSKRDPELRREISAYRILRRQLREWDEAENSEPPSSALAERALSRVGAFLAATAPPATRWGVWALAAGMLAAVGLGAMLSTDTPTSIRVDVGNALAKTEVAPIESHRVAGGTVTLRESPGLPDFQPLHPVLKRGLRGWMVDGHIWTRESLQFLIDWSEERDQLNAWTQRHPVKPETRTGTWRPEIMTLVRGYEPGAVPLDSLVVFRHQVAVDVPAVRAMPTGSTAKDFRSDPTMLLVSERRDSWLLLAGEVFVGRKDRSQRIRVVGASSWASESSFVPMKWADKIAMPENSRLLTLWPTMLGPKARHALANGKPPVVNLKRKVDERVVQKLLQGLRDDAAATGFAVLADGKVVGVELFASHDLLLEFAPRLLRGYVLESGKALRLRAPTRAIEDLAELAGGVVDRIAQGAQRLVDVPGGVNELWPKNVRRVNIMAGRTAIAGHGLLYENRPLHITLFAQ